MKSKKSSVQIKESSEWKRTMKICNMNNRCNLKKSKSYAMCKGEDNGK